MYLGFIIPGIATNVNLVLTLVTLEAQHQILGQACLSLRDLDPYVAQDITFSLTGNIVVSKCRLRTTHNIIPT